MLFSAIRHGRQPVKLAADGGTLVRVRGGYSPEVVYARAGEPIRITFLREETALCSEQVMFPAFGKCTMLPCGKKTVVELPPSPPGTYEFTCAMNMLHGRLVVQEPG
jgi:plastocyanin domain-containing protein